MAWWGRATEAGQQLVNGVQFFSIIAICCSVGMLFGQAGRFLFTVPLVRVKVLWMIAMIWWMAIVGIFGGVVPAEGPATTIGFVVSDIASLAYCFAPLSLAFLTEMELKRAILIAAVALGLLFLTTYNRMDFVQAAAFKDRSGVFNELGGVASLHNGVAAAVLPLAAVGLALAKSRVTAGFAIAVVPLALTVAIFYSKRQPALEVALFVVYLSASVLSREISKRQRLVVVFGIVVGIGVILNYLFKDAFLVLLSRLTGRVSELGESGITGFDRVEEARNFILNANALRVLTGHGIGSVSDDLVAVSMLHMGVANLLYKGGIIFVILVVVMLLRNVKLSLERKEFPCRILIFYLSVSTLIQLSYAPLWGFVPSVITIGLGLFAPEIVLVRGRLQKATQVPYRQNL